MLDDLEEVPRVAEDFPLVVFRELLEVGDAAAQQHHDQGEGEVLVLRNLRFRDRGPGDG